MSRRSFLNKPILTILCGAMIISFSGVWVVLSDVEASVSAFYRVFFGFLFLLPCCLWRREFRQLQPSVVALVLLCGFFFAADLIFWHLSIVAIGPGLATIIGNFQVFILTLISLLFFGDIFRVRFIASLPLAFLGLLIVIGFDWRSLPENYRLGLLYGLATACCYSAFILSLRKLQSIQQSISFFYTLMLASLATSLFLGLQSLAVGNSLRIPDQKSLLALLCLGLFSQTIGWTLITNSLPKLRPATAGLILLLQPALAFVWDVVLFSRPTTLLHWFGVTLTLVAIYLGMTASGGE